VEEAKVHEEEEEEKKKKKKEEEDEEEKQKLTKVSEKQAAYFRTYGGESRILRKITSYPTTRCHVRYHNNLHSQPWRSSYEVSHNLYQVCGWNINRTSAYPHSVSDVHGGVSGK